MTERPTPYYGDPEAGITIYCGDCVEAMRGMEDNSVDAVVSRCDHRSMMLGHTTAGSRTA